MSKWPAGKTIMGQHAPTVVGAGGGCFAAGTLVSTPTGRVPIETIKIGDVVIAFDDKGALHEAPVTGTFAHEHEDVSTYELWGGISLTATSNHWVLNQYGTFACISTLTEQDMFIDERGHLRPFLSSTHVGTQTVYNLHVQGYCTFIANGIRVHNGGIDLAPVVAGSGGGGGKGGGGGHTPVEAPNTLRSKSLARIIDLLCEGPIVGLCKGAQSIFLDNTPLQNPDGSYNFSGITWDMRLGDPDQDYMPGFSAVETEVNVNTEVKYGKPIARTVADPMTDALRVKIRLGSLYHQSMENGDITGTSVSFAWQVSNNGGPWETVISDTISGKTMSAYERAYRIQLKKGGHPWQIRLVRTTGDSDKSTLNNSTFFSAFTQIIDSKLMYPDSSYVGLQVDASMFGTNIPARHYEVYGRIIQVPSNYDTETRKYTGLWDGTFHWKYSNNPAWVYYDILTNSRYGLGREIGEHHIDKWGLYAISQYCDELVNDGRGGKEPRFVFNGSMHNREDAIKVLSALAGSFRGMIYYAGGSIYVAQDRPTEPRRLLTPANVINGTFTYEGSSMKARHSVALVSWLDPEDGFNPAVFVYEDPESIAEFGWRTTDIMGFGCTSEGQAARWAAMTIDGEKYATETVSFGTGLDCTDIMPGDVVAIADPAYAGVRAGGRLKEVSMQHFRLDAPYPFDPDEEYQIAIIHPDNAVEELNILNPKVETDSITLESPISRKPEVGSIFIIVATNLYPRLFRILAITEGEGITLNFVGLLYDPNKYARVEEGIDLPPRPGTLFPTGPLKPPFDLRAREYLYIAPGGTVRSAVAFSWQANDPRFVGFEVQWQPPGHDWFAGAMTTVGLTIDIHDTLPGTYTFRVRGFDSLGRQSAWAVLTIDLTGLLEPPADVYPFRMETRGPDSQLTWGRVPDLDLSHYQIRYSPVQEGATWETSSILMDRIPANATSVMVPTRAGTYLIKAVDFSGIESRNATFITTEGLNLDGINVIEVLTEDPDFSGRHDGTTVEQEWNALILAHNPAGDFFGPEDFFDFEDFFIADQGIVGYGRYYFKHSLDLGAVYTSRLSSHIVFSLLYMQSDFFSKDDMFDWPDFFGPDVTSVKVHLELRSTDKDPRKEAYPDEDAWNAIWTEWRPFVYGDVQARAFEFRCILQSGEKWVTPMVTELSVEIDMPDRVTSGDDIVIPAQAGGVKVPFLPPFLNVPAVTVTVQDLQSYPDGTVDRFDIVEKHSDYFVISITDPQGNPVERTLDFLAKGYGFRFEG